MKISRKTGLYFALACVLLATAILYYHKMVKVPAPSPTPGTVTNEIVLGAVLPLTGPSGWNGEMFRNGLDMAVNEINASDSPISFVLDVEDSKSDADEGPKAYRRLSAKGIKFFVAHGGQYLIGFAPETNNTDKILFVSAAPNSNLLQLTNRCFRIFPTVDMVTDQVVDCAVKNGYSRIAVIYMQNQAYTMYYQSVVQKLKDIGKEVVFVESYTPKTRDFKNIVSKMATKQVDFLYSAGAGEASALLTNQLYSNPKTANIPVIGDMNFSNPDNLKIIGPLKSPLYTIDNYFTDAFRDKYQSLYNQSANGFAVYGYIIPYLIRKAFLALGPEATTDDVYEYIRTHSFETAGGAVSFDPETGEPNLDILIRTSLPN